MFLIPIFFSLIIFFSSCKHEPLVPVNPTVDTIRCDSGTVYFENQILPILLSSCSMTDCHDKVSHKEGVILTDYNSLMNSNIVKAGKSYDSKLYEVITETGNDRMPPKPRTALSFSQIEEIRKWIDQGAKNNKCNACDTTDYRYSTKISFIISNNCKGCHSGVNLPQGVRLESYNDVKAIADDGRLKKVIVGQGYLQMPPAGKLDDCKINLINKWVDAGAPNN